MRWVLLCRSFVICLALIAVITPQNLRADLCPAILKVFVPTEYSWYNPMRLVVPNPRKMSGQDMASWHRDAALGSAMRTALWDKLAGKHLSAREERNRDIAIIMLEYLGLDRRAVTSRYEKIVRAAEGAYVNLMHHRSMLDMLYQDLEQFESYEKALPIEEQAGFWKFGRRAGFRQEFKDKSNEVVVDEVPLKDFLAERLVAYKKNGLLSERQEERLRNGSLIDLMRFIETSIRYQDSRIAIYENQFGYYFSEWKQVNVVLELLSTADLGQIVKLAENVVNGSMIRLSVQDEGQRDVRASAIDVKNELISSIHAVVTDLRQNRWSRKSTDELVVLLRKHGLYEGELEKTLSGARIPYDRNEFLNRLVALAKELEVNVDAFETIKKQMGDMSPAQVLASDLMQQIQAAPKAAGQTHTLQALVEALSIDDTGGVVKVTGVAYSPEARSGMGAGAAYQIGATVGPKFSLQVDSSTAREVLIRELTQLEVWIEQAAKIQEAAVMVQGEIGIPVSATRAFNNIGVLNDGTEISPPTFKQMMEYFDRVVNNVSLAQKWENVSTRDGFSDGGLTAMRGMLKRDEIAAGFRVIESIAAYAADSGGAGFHALQKIPGFSSSPKPGEGVVSKGAKLGAALLAAPVKMPVTYIAKSLYAQYLKQKFKGHVAILRVASRNPARLIETINKLDAGTDGQFLVYLIKHVELRDQVDIVIKHLLEQGAQFDSHNLLGRLDTAVELGRNLEPISSIDPNSYARIVAIPVLYFGATRIWKYLSPFLLEGGGPALSAPATAPADPEDAPGDVDDAGEGILPGFGIFEKWFGQNQKNELEKSWLALSEDSRIDLLDTLFQMIELEKEDRPMAGKSGLMNSLAQKLVGIAPQLMRQLAVGMQVSF